MNNIQQIISMRAAGVPLIYFRTADPVLSIGRLRDKKAFMDFEYTDQEVPLIHWDPALGYTSINEFGRIQIASHSQQGAVPGQPPGQGIAKLPTSALAMLDKFADRSVAFFCLLTPAEFFKDPQVVQYVYMLRDNLKKRGKQLIFIGPSFPVPTALKDIEILTDPYPKLDDLKKIVEHRYKTTKEKNPKMVEIGEEKIHQAAVAMQGHTDFSADTAISLSFREKSGIDFHVLREQLYKRIDDTPGLKIYRGKETFDQLKGLDGVQGMLRRIGKNMKRPPGCVVYIEEINLSSVTAGGKGGDTSKTSDSMLGNFLTWMEDLQVLGILLMGLAGTGKSSLGKALGNELGLPCLEMSFDKMMDRWVGSTQQNQEVVFQTIEALSGRNPLILASCNNADNLSSALWRRFRLGKIFFDLPNAIQKKLIWDSKMAYYNLKAQQLPDDTGWCGAEIDVACQNAWMFDCSIMEASENIIADSLMREAEILQMRQNAHMRYISAATGRPYNMNTLDEVFVEKGGDRKVYLAPEEIGH